MNNSNMNNYELNKFYKIKDTEYHSLNYMSYHQLKDFMLSPKHWDASKRNKKETDAMRFGTIAHSAILEPLQFNLRHKVSPDVDLRTKDGKFQLEAFKAELKHDDIIVKRQELETIRSMQSEMFSNPDFEVLFKDARHIEEFALVEINMNNFLGVTNCPNVVFKFKPDFITATGNIVDYKTTQCASLTALSNECQNRHYYSQLYFYSFLYSIITGSKINEIAYIIGQEKEDPYCSMAITVNAYHLGYGYGYIKNALYNYYRFLMNDKKLTGYRTGLTVANSINTY